MSYQFGDRGALPPVNINERHLLVTLLLDNSGSTYGTPIQNINAAVNRFAKDVCKDEKAAGLVDTCVISFNDAPSLVQDWVPIDKMAPINLTAGGGTDISAALDFAIKKTRERTHLFESNGGELFTPFIIMLTDGYGGDVTEISKVIKKRTDDKKMKLWTLCVKGYDKESIAKLTEGKRVFELVDEVGYDFTDFFDFMALSVKAVSTSSPDERVHVENPLEKKDTNLRVPNLDAWLND